MQKITFLFTMLLVIIFSWQAQAQFPESFEATVPPTGWASFIGTNGEGTARNWTSSIIANSGAQAAFVRFENVPNSAEDWLVTPQFTPTAGTPILTFMQRQAFSLPFGTTYTVRVSSASQTTHADFTIIDTQAEGDFSTIYNAHNIDLSAYIGTPIYLAFVMQQDDGDNWYIDDVDLIATATAPSCADTPTPTDTATNVVLATDTVTLSWLPSTIGDPATSYEIFWGTTSGSLTSLGSLGATTINITDLDYDTTYYWSIVSSNFGGSATGCSEWSFTTGSAPPPPTNDTIAGAGTAPITP
ncbi:MAG: fibronectin type III domain-containing protein [Flavobacteriaceae bacterium]|nr:fibronectin type III domain-containing protein [Flavobacteriaceae bacterium]